MDEMKIKPAFEKNNIAVVLSSDGNYVPYLAVTIKSIFDNADPKYNYDVLVFDDGITDHQKALMRTMIKSNCSIRYINMKELLVSFDTTLLKERGSWTAAAAYRLFIPEIMPDYDRVLYLDCDILVKDSLVELFKLDLDKYQIACVCDCIKYYPKKNRIRDCEEKLGLKNYQNYFNSGVVLFNLRNINAKDFKADFIKYASSKQLPFFDQDILNIIFEGKCKFLDWEWNYQYHLLNETPHLREIEELDRADNNPKIIHYTTSRKPWSHPELPHAYEWWCVARVLPFYEEIIFKNTRTNSILLRNLVRHKRLIVKYVICKLLRLISFGRFKRKISSIYNKLQNQVRAVRAIFKGK